MPNDAGCLSSSKGTKQNDLDSAAAVTQQRCETWIAVNETTSENSATCKASNGIKRPFVAGNPKRTTHSQTQGTKRKFSDPQNETERPPPKSRKASKCFKRNQRRARRREEKRAAKVKSFAVPGAHNEARPSFLFVPYDVLVSGVLSFLHPKDLANVECCCKTTKNICRDGTIWKSQFKRQFLSDRLSPNTMCEWKLAYKLTHTATIGKLRCSQTKRNFFEDVLGTGVDYTVNPKTRCVDYISLSHDLLSETAFRKLTVRTDVFGKKIQLFLPMFFSRDHFQRALPQIRRTIFRLCPDQEKTRFDPEMVLDAFPKLINTFVVLVADEGISVSMNSFVGLNRVHRLFLALAHQYPVIKREALSRLQKFAAKDGNRIKKTCPNLGHVLPLLLIVDQKEFGWAQLRSAYLRESFDRSAMWVCKEFPELARTRSLSGEVESDVEGNVRVALTLEAMTVSMRLLMINIYFLRACCRGTTEESAQMHDSCLGQEKERKCAAGAPAAAEASLDKPPHAAVVGPHHQMSFSHFQNQVRYIFSVNTWEQFFNFVGATRPPSKAAMAHFLRQCVENSRRKGYHRAGMDFSRIQASGTSKILAKSQAYSASTELRRVTFTNVWGFSGSPKYLDATCFLYRDKTLIHTVDYRQRLAISGAVRHSGDVMRVGGGTHRIRLNLEALGHANVTTCFFVISAWADATLEDIVSPSISFTDADAVPGAAPLCTYDLDAHDKVEHLTSVIMCKLYRARNGGWHVVAIGDAHKGAADDYAPLYPALCNLI